MGEARDEDAGAEEDTRNCTLSVPGMDCAAEEQLVRMALEGAPEVRRVGVDLEARQVRVVHSGSADAVLARLLPLGFGAEIAALDTTEEPARDASDPAAERRVLRLLLAINAVMFVIELALGLVAESTGLIADSLDMFADATVYGLSLYAVGRSLASQQRAARASGWLEMALALSALAEVGRRAVFGSRPNEVLIIAVAALALVANVTCVALLSKHRTGGVHLQASYIFSTNDVLANVGVITAGVLVALTGAAWPDLVVGTGVGLLVLWGAIRILRLRPS